MSVKQPPAVAVYCASSIGTQKAYQLAALCLCALRSTFLPELISIPPLTALGNALASSSRPLVYGGGSKGIMGIVSGAVLQGGGEVTGVVPWAMIKAGGEGDKGIGAEKVQPNEKKLHVVLDEKGREKVSPSGVSEVGRAVF